MGLFSKTEKVAPPEFNNSYYQPALNAGDLVPQAATGYVNSNSKPAVPPKPYGFDDFHRRHSSTSSSNRTSNGVYTNGYLNVNNQGNKILPQSPNQQQQVVYVPVAVNQQGGVPGINYPVEEERGRHGHHGHQGYYDNRISSSVSPHVGYGRSRSRHGSRPHSIGASHGRYASPPDSSIYDRNSLSSILNSSNHPLAPEIDLYDREYDDEQFRARSRSSACNLISILSKLKGRDINEDNRYLYRLFRTFDKEYATVDDLRELLVDPYYLKHFSYDSVDRIVRIFAPSGYGLTYRDFIKVCVFLKGCYECFAFYDTDGSHHLELDEFSKSLTLNRVNCPDNLILKIFREGRLNLERYCVAVVTLRTYENRQRY